MIQFIKDGPLIPDELEEALRNDELVLFCGSGISIPNGLPDFEDLVEQVCKNLKINIDEHHLLKKARDEKKYDTILSLIEGNQKFSVSSKDLRNEVIYILSPNENNHNIHKNLLDLSSLPDNQGYRIVTTNFDKLFFKANPTLKQYDAAPKIILPRKGVWKNLTFLHGLIDTTNYPNGDNLILTKKDFGLAYLKDNWASQFIIQLFEEFTVLFIGYSLNDPVMNYLLSAISYENHRKARNNIAHKNSKKIETIYAFVGYEESENEDKEKDDKKIKAEEWESNEVHPILYKIKSDDHSLLYNTIEKWANLKTTGFTGRKAWLRDKVKAEYKDSDKNESQTLISYLKIDEKIAEYFPKIDLCDDGSKNFKPVSISWLKPLDEAGLLKKLTTKTREVHAIPLWEPLSQIEIYIIQWLCHHLDKQELIHWLVKQHIAKNGIIYLHPEFKNQIKNKLDSEKKKDLSKEELFWKILITQKNQSENIDSYDLETLITNLNDNYTNETAVTLLSCLEPVVAFTTYPGLKKGDPDINYEPKLKATHFSNTFSKEFLRLDKSILLKHAEDFSYLLKKAMELAQYSGIIHDQYDLFYIDRPSISENEQNEHSPTWTYLIDLVRDSFDCAMEKDQNSAKVLLSQWQLYPYSIFYRLILYAVTKHSILDEEIVIKLFEEKPKTLWSVTCQNEVYKYLRNKKHSEDVTQKLCDLIIKEPPETLFRSDITEKDFNEFKKRMIYKNLNRLKQSGAVFSQEIQEYHDAIQTEYSLPKKDLNDFPVYFPKARVVGDEKRYHNWEVQKIYEDLKNCKVDTHPAERDDKKENFRRLVRDDPKKAFEALSHFENGKGVFFWCIFIAEISNTTSNENDEFLLKSFQKIEKCDDKAIIECLWYLAFGLRHKGSLVYRKDQEYFKKLWKRLWKLSLKTNNKNNVNNNFSHEALNSNLGILSWSIFNILWSQYSKNIPRNGHIHSDIKGYFKTILEQGSKENPSIAYHFGSYLWHLWFLDKDWIIDNLKPLISWKKNPYITQALWDGYLHHPIADIDFSHDFKDELLELFKNSNEFLSLRDETGYFESIANLFRATTGCHWQDNIFNEEETKEIRETIIQNLDIKILESISRQIWQLLKDAEDKSENLWSEKLKLWIKEFWPRQISKKDPRITRYFALSILHCGSKIPEAFEFFKAHFEETTQKYNDSFIAHHILDDKNSNLQKNIYNYPNELIQILKWHFSEGRINDYDNSLTKILNKIRNKILNPNSDIKNKQQLQIAIQNLEDKIRN